NAADRADHAVEARVHLLKPQPGRSAKDDTDQPAGVDLVLRHDDLLDAVPVEINGEWSGLELEEVTAAATLDVPDHLDLLAATFLVDGHENGFDVLDEHLRFALRHTQDEGVHAGAGVVAVGDDLQPAASGEIRELNREDPAEGALAVRPVTFEGLVHDLVDEDLLAVGDDDSWNAVSRRHRHVHRDHGVGEPGDLLQGERRFGA